MYVEYFEGWYKGWLIGEGVIDTMGWSLGGQIFPTDSLPIVTSPSSYPPPHWRVDDDGPYYIVTCQGSGVSSKTLATGQTRPPGPLAR